MRKREAVDEGRAGRGGAGRLGIVTTAPAKCHQRGWLWQRRVAGRCSESGGGDVSLQRRRREHSHKRSEHVKRYFSQ